MKKTVIRDCTIFEENCLDVLPTLEPVDLVVTDPPYGCAYKTNHRRTLETPEMLANDDKPNLAFVKPIVEAVKPNSAIYLCTRFDVYAQWEQALKDAGTTLKTTVVWDKGNWTAGDLEGDYGNQVELILYAHVGRSLLRKGRPSNLWSIPRDPPGKHPTPKPVELFKRCILNSSDPGDLVLDAFLGGGTSGFVVSDTLDNSATTGCTMSPSQGRTAHPMIEVDWINHDKPYDGGIAGTPMASYSLQDMPPITPTVAPYEPPGPDPETPPVAVVPEPTAAILTISAVALIYLLFGKKRQKMYRR